MLNRSDSSRETTTSLRIPPATSSRANAWFPTAGHYARYNATAPIEASSGPTKRHRLNPNGNRQLNHAIHIAALGQISHDTPGRAYYLAKQAQGKSSKEAMRCLKRRISDAVYQRLRSDTGH